MLKVHVDEKKPGFVIGTVKREVKMEVDDEEDELPLVCLSSIRCSLYEP